MEKKNMVLLTVIAVATLLVAVVGATFAYFTANITDNRQGEGTPGEAAITAAKTPGSLTIEKSDTGFASFNDENVYPGHKALVQLKVTTTSNNPDTYFDIVYKGTNGFPNDKIQFTLYESKDPITGTNANKAYTCDKISETDENGKTYKLYETCTLDSNLKTNPENTKLLQTKTLTKSDNTVVLNGDHPFLITSDSNPKTLYYYVVVEYVNNDSQDQSADEIGKTLSGNISIEIAPRDDQAISDSDPQKLTTKNAEP